MKFEEVVPAVSSVLGFATDLPDLAYDMLASWDGSVQDDTYWNLRNLTYANCLDILRCSFCKRYAKHMA